MKLNKILLAVVISFSGGTLLGFLLQPLVANLGEKLEISLAYVLADVPNGSPYKAFAFVKNVGQRTSKSTQLQLRTPGGWLCPATLPDVPKPHPESKLAFNIDPLEPGESRPVVVFFQLGDPSCPCERGTCESSATFCIDCDNPPARPGMNMKATWTAGFKGQSIQAVDQFK